MFQSIDYQLFDFAVTGSVPRTDAQIARAKRQAVGGKRKRCTKGKNCSAACIAAHMVCMVDLPWVVGSALTKTVAQIQAKKGKTPVAKTAPKVTTPAAGGAPVQPSQSNLASFKKSLKTQTDKTLNSLLTTYKDKLTPEQRKAIQDEIKARSKATTPKAPSKAQQAALAKVPSVEGYKKWGLAALEEMLKEDVPKWNAKNPVTQKADKNIREAIKQLKAEEAAKAKGAAAATKTKATPTTKTSAQKTSTSSQPAASSTPKQIEITPSDTNTSLIQKAKAAGFSTKEIGQAVMAVSKNPKDWSNADLKQVAQALNNKTKTDSQKASSPTPQGAPKSTRTNPWALSSKQEDTWKSALGKYDEQSWENYKNVSGGSSTLKSTLKTPEERKQNQLLKVVNEGLSQPLYDAYQDRAVGPSAPSFLKKAEQNMGDGAVMRALKSIREFSDSAYSYFRAAQQNRVPRDEEWRGDQWKKDTIKKYKKKADDMEALLTYLPKPQVPKFRGVAVDDDRLDALKQLVKDRGVMVERSMNSWSTKSRVAETFARDSEAVGYGSNQIIYRTMNKNGAPIKELSVHSGEDELLTKANSNYRFFDYQEVDVGKGQKLHIFDVIEF